MIGNKRVLERKPFQQRCWIAQEASASLIECFIQDISHTGAKLVLGTEFKLPKKLDLYLTPDGSVGRICQVAWQANMEVGVKFIGRSVPRRSPLESAETSIVVET